MQRKERKEYNVVYAINGELKDQAVVTKYCKLPNH